MLVDNTPNLPMFTDVRTALGGYMDSGIYARTSKAVVFWRIKQIFNMHEIRAERQCLPIFGIINERTRLDLCY